MNGGFFGSLIQVIDAMLTLFSLMLVAYAMISWVRPDLNNSVMRFLRSMVEPVLTPVRKVLPPMSTAAEPVGAVSATWGRRPQALAKCVMALIASDLPAPPSPTMQMSGGVVLASCGDLAVSAARCRSQGTPRQKPNVYRR